MKCSRFKLRMWNKLKKRYEERYVIGSDGLAYQLVDAGDNWYDLIPNEEVIIEQCTGLKDKNGNLIYEGDVLVFDISVYPIYVLWDSYKCRFMLKRFDVEGWEISLIQDTASNYTITGNIHEKEE